MSERASEEEDELREDDSPTKRRNPSKLGRNLNNNQKTTRQLIGHAAKVLDGEKAYNNADLDRFLMGI